MQRNIEASSVPRSVTLLRCHVVRGGGKEDAAMKESATVTYGRLRRVKSSSRVRDLSSFGLHMEMPFLDRYEGRRLVMNAGARHVQDECEDSESVAAHHLGIRAVLMQRVLV